MTPTNEQALIIQHDPSKHGRVLSGPGTGKSWTCVQLVKRLQEKFPSLKIGMLTFTRAATKELNKEMGKVGKSKVFPSTIHSFALSLLLAYRESGQLINPLRIADSWELEKLVRPNIARRLRDAGFERVNSKTVKNLEQELSAKWQSLDDNQVLIADFDPYVRNAYVGLWETHRPVFGYTLLAELPFRAANVIEDFGLKIGPIDFLMVDEYQDLNKADIKLILLLVGHGTKVLAIGDDDQSIYNFRMAAPEGIRRFPEDVDGCVDYSLTLSQRCGRNIIEAATALIQTTPNRPKKPSLRYREDVNPGEYKYLRFDDDEDEIRGVADLILARNREGVALSDIVVLARSSIDFWARGLIPQLQERHITAIETDWIDTFLEDPEYRSRLAGLRLLVEPTDSLAWWALLKLTKNISQRFRDYIYSRSLIDGDTFGRTLLNLAPDFPGAPRGPSSSTAASLIDQVRIENQKIDLDGIELGETGWASFFLDYLGRDKLEADVTSLIENAGHEINAQYGLGYFLGQLEPVAKDLAAKSDSVRIMTMTTSKGITVDTCIVMGVERGIIPHPKAKSIEEERRLLYVGMTRAKQLTILTFANRRTGQTAMSGDQNIGRPRGRSPLLESLPIGDYEDGYQYVEARLNRSSWL